MKPDRSDFDEYAKDRSPLVFLIIVGVVVVGVLAGIGYWIINVLK